MFVVGVIVIYKNVESQWFEKIRKTTVSQCRWDLIFFRQVKVKIGMYERITFRTSLSSSTAVGTTALAVLSHDQYHSSSSFQLKLKFFKSS